MSQQIPRKELDAAYRRTCRRIAACIIKAMAETDVGFPQMAERLGQPEEKIRAYVQHLIDGTGKNLSIAMLAHIGLAMDCEWHFSISRAEKPAEPPPEDR